MFSAFAGAQGMEHPEPLGFVAVCKSGDQERRGSKDEDQVRRQLLETNRGL